MRLLPVASIASNARMRPSGEMRGMSTDTTSGGTSTSNRIVRFGCGARFQKPKPSASAATTATAAMAHASSLAGSAPGDDGRRQPRLRAALLRSTRAAA